MAESARSGRAIRAAHAPRDQREPGDRDLVGPGENVEDAAGSLPAQGEQLGAGSDDGEGFPERQLAGQVDGSQHIAIEHHGVAGGRARDGVAERAAPRVGDVQDLAKRRAGGASRDEHAKTEQHRAPRPKCEGHGEVPPRCELSPMPAVAKGAV